MVRRFLEKNEMAVIDNLSLDYGFNQAKKSIKPLNDIISSIVDNEYNEEFINEMKCIENEKSIPFDKLKSQENIPKLRFPEFNGNWKLFKLKELAKIQRGASPRPINDKKWYDTNNKNVGWVRIGDVTDSNKFLFKTEDYFSEEGVKKSRFLPKGSLIMSICATIGKLIITNLDTCIHDGFVGFTKLKNIDKEFLYYVLFILEGKFCALGQTGSQSNLNSDLIRNMKIKIPNIDEQRKIVEFLSLVDKKIELMERNIIY